jgi:hypothetical protein
LWLDKTASIMVLDQHGILLKMVVMVSQHHLTGTPCWSWLIWFIDVSTRRWWHTPWGVLTFGLGGLD